MEIAKQYAEDVISGEIPASKYRKKCCKRFLKDFHNPKYEIQPKDADFVINIIQKQLVHMQGEDLEGRPLRGRPFLLLPFHIMIVVGLLAVYHTGTQIRKYKEAFIYIPRKNVKTTFAAALSWGVGILNRKSGSKGFIVAAALKQALEAFTFLKFNAERLLAEDDEDSYRIIDNNNEHSIEIRFDDGGSLKIEALAANPDVQDSFNCNFAIADEMHAFKKPKQYTLFRDAMKAYTNKLMIGITTAGDNMNSYCYRRLQYAKKVLDDVVQDEKLFIFLCEADEDENGKIDYTNPKVHEEANPAYRETIRPDDILSDSLQAQNDPQERKDFLSKSLNVYTSAMKAYFDIGEFQRSDEQYNWSLEELAKMKIKWYGGADLSKLHDLTAAAMAGEYEDVLILITHGWFPIVKARAKAEEDSIPIFGWEEDGLLTMVNSPTLETDEPVDWFVKKRKAGFKIRQVGHDRKFARKY